MNITKLIQYKWLSGLSEREIAKDLGIPISIVKEKTEKLSED